MERFIVGRVKRSKGVIGRARNVIKDAEKSVLRLKSI